MTKIPMRCAIRGFKNRRQWSDAGLAPSSGIELAIVARTRAGRAEKKSYLLNIRNVTLLHPVDTGRRREPKSNVLKRRRIS